MPPTYDNTRPNFLVFLTDEQQTKTLGCYGNTICRTPHIDSLAEGGVRFDNCYVQNPLCIPSRATIMTGQYPSGHGVRANGINLDESIPMITTLLKEAGYRTASFGKIHLNTFGGKTPQESKECQAYWEEYECIPPPYMGFDTLKVAVGHNDYAHGEHARWVEAECPGGMALLQFERALDPPSGAIRTWNAALPAEYYSTNWVADQTIDYLCKVGDDPFLVFCSFPDPHPSFCPPAPYCTMYDAADVPSPPYRVGELDDMPPHFARYYAGTDEWFKGLFSTGKQNSRSPNQHTDYQLRDMIAHYWGMVSFIDEAIGRIIKILAARGLRNKTVVTFTSDHGDLMGDHGLIFKGPFHYDSLLRVPMIWNCPDQFEPNRVNDAMVGSVDIAPTILELAGLGQPDCMRGCSYAGYLDGGSMIEREGILTENDDELFKRFMRTITTREWKMTVYAGHSSAGSSFAGRTSAERPCGELFDRRNDPDELYNLWQDPGYDGIRRDLADLMLDQILLTTSLREPRLGVYG